jgi:hypothetical protein
MSMLTLSLGNSPTNALAVGTSNDNDWNSAFNEEKKIPSK